MVYGGQRHSMNHWFGSDTYFIPQKYICSLVSLLSSSANLGQTDPWLVWLIG